MIIEVVKTKGVHFECDICKTCFIWTPENEDGGFIWAPENEDGGCTLTGYDHPCSKQIECRFYEPEGKKCPECGSSHITEISALGYRIKRWIRR